MYYDLEKNNLRIKVEFFSFWSKQFKLKMTDSIQQPTTDSIDLQAHPSPAKSLGDSNGQWQEFDVDFKRVRNFRISFFSTK